MISVGIPPLDIALSKYSVINVNLIISLWWRVTEHVTFAVWGGIYLVRFSNKQSPTFAFSDCNRNVMYCRPESFYWINIGWHAVPVSLLSHHDQIVSSRELNSIWSQNISISNLINGEFICTKFPSWPLLEKNNQPNVFYSSHVLFENCVLPCFMLVLQSVNEAWKTWIQRVSWCIFMASKSNNC